MQADRSNGDASSVGGNLPTAVIWDITYACPLLCTHCYSESGRRDSKQLDPAELLRVTDAIIAMRPRDVFLSGGEPLIVKGVLDVVSRLSGAGIATHIFTSGWNLDDAKVAAFAPLLRAIHVSLDGATAEVHDSIRRRNGSFDRAQRALTALDTYCRTQRAAGRRPLQFGIDSTIIRRNFHQLELFVTDIAARFPEMAFVNLGAAAPTGLAGEAKFAEEDLLSEDQLDVMRDPEIGARLSADGLLVGVSDNRYLQMHPDDIEAGLAMTTTAQVEPDGNVRAMAIYEGTVGNLLTERPEVIWAHAKERWRDPFVVEQLRNAQTRVEWARATRAIDEKFGEPDDLVRISKRRAT